MKTAIAFVLFFVGAAYAQEMKNCPMHAQHMAQAAAQHDHYSEVDRRGNIGMGFDQQRSSHHFVLANDGGSIEVQANSKEDAKTITNIRAHLQHIAQAFAQGDFALPMFIHDQPAPRSDVMARLKNDLTYRYEETPLGGRVVIHSANTEAVAAVHDFLKFQIAEHRTGDSARMQH